MLDGMMNVLSGCDIVSPTISLFRSMRNGPSVRFLVQFDAGWSADSVRKMLESKGVIVWALDVAGDNITFKVRETQARYAAYWLQRHRLPFETPAGEDFSGKGGASGGKAKGDANGATEKSANEKKSGMFDGVLDRIDKLADSL